MFVECCIARKHGAACRPTPCKDTTIPPHVQTRAAKISAPWQPPSPFATGKSGGHTPRAAWHGTRTAHGQCKHFSGRRAVRPNAWQPGSWPEAPCHAAKRPVSKHGTGCFAPPDGPYRKPNRAARPCGKAFVNIYHTRPQHGVGTKRGHNPAATASSGHGAARRRKPPTRREAAKGKVLKYQQKALTTLRVAKYLLSLHRSC